MKAYRSLAAAAALCAGTVSARTSINVPGNDDFKLSFAVPQTAQSNGFGNLYMSLRAPTSYAWVAVGTGSGMVGANIFMIYQDGAGNVTVSPRSGTGLTQPQFNADAEIEVLEGTRVEDGEMIANIRCGNCESWSGGTLDFKGMNRFVAAWKQGSFSSPDPQSGAINKHDGKTGFQLSLGDAVIAQDANPFAGATEVIQENTPGGGVTVIADSGPDKKLVIHGIVMAVTFAVLYPTGAFLMPLLGKWLVHASWQMFAFTATWVGFAFGYIWADEIGILFKQPHTILGTVVCVMMVFQPVFGWLHHRHYLKHKSRGTISYIHIYYGRVLMLAGLINGGLGLRLANADQNLVIAYVVVAIGLSLVYAVVVFVKGMRKSRKVKEDYSSSRYEDYRAQPVPQTTGGYSQPAYQQQPQQQYNGGNYGYSSQNYR